MYSCPEYAKIIGKIINIKNWSILLWYVYLMDISTWENLEG